MKKHEIMINKSWFGLITVVAYAFAIFVGEKGYTFSLDSPQYISMQPYLPPFYPSFLYILRIMLGTFDYLQVAVWIQSGVWAVSVALIIEYLTLHFHMPRWTNLLFFIALILPLSRGDSRPWYFGTHAILTEGLSFAFFNIYFIVLLKSLFEKDGKANYWLWLWTGILILTRDQFLLCLGLSLCSWVYRIWRFRLKKGFLVVGFGMMLLTWLVCGAVQDIYKLAISGSTNNTWRSSSTLTHLLYSCDEEDGERVSKGGRELFETLYRSLDDIQYSYKYAEGNFYEKGEHYSEGFNTANNTVRDILEREELKGKDKETISNSVDDIIHDLLPVNIKWLRISLLQLPKSLANSIFFVRPPFELQFISMAGILYLGAFILLGWTIKKQGWNDVVVFMGVILGFVFVNSIATEFAIRSIARYLSYTMGFFYIAGFILMWEILKECCKRDNEN